MRVANRNGRNFSALSPGLMLETNMTDMKAIIGAAVVASFLALGACGTLTGAAVGGAAGAAIGNNTGDGDAKKGAAIGAAAGAIAGTVVDHH